MEYKNILPGEFISRPNRFIAHVKIDGKTEICHVKNTGRCREILVSGAKVFVSKADNPNRSTGYDLISVWKDQRLINIDSGAPNKVFYQWLRGGGYIQNISLIKPEAAYGSSRLDCYIEAGERRIYAEVKGATLERSGAALFPDAPTQRGVRHIEELCRCIDEGYEAMIVFIVQMKGVSYFTPNYETHAEFGNALKTAEEKGVKIIALDCEVSETGITAGDFVEVRL